MVGAGAGPLAAKAVMHRAGELAIPIAVRIIILPPYDQDTGTWGLNHNDRMPLGRPAQY